LIESENGTALTKLMVKMLNETEITKISQIQDGGCPPC
jgi:hypothetical protein